MAEVAEAVCSAAADPRLALHVHDPGWVVGERPSLERALVNLVENARTYGPSGEPIEVTVARAGEHVAVAVLIGVRASPRRRPSSPPSASGAAPTRSPARAPGWGWRWSAPPSSATAVGWRSAAPA